MADHLLHVPRSCMRRIALFCAASWVTVVDFACAFQAARRAQSHRDVAQLRAALCLGGVTGSSERDRTGGAGGD